MVTIEQILYIIPILGLAASITYYAIILNNANKMQKLQLETRQLQIFMQLNNILNTKESLIDFIELINIKVNKEEYRQKYDSYVNPEHFAKRANLWYTYNSIGELLRLNMVDPDLLHRLNVDSNVIMMWEKWEHIIKMNREREQMPDLWDGFEYLYNEMKALRNKMGYPEIMYEP